MISYPRFSWGKDIRVTVSADHVEVASFIEVLREDESSDSDPLAAYRRSITRFSGGKRQGKRSPHINFANADTDQKLMQFVERFGPVVASSWHIEERTPVNEDSGCAEALVAIQDLTELRRERDGYRAAITLISELQNRTPKRVNIKKCLGTILETTSFWPQQWRRERGMKGDPHRLADVHPWIFGHGNFIRLKQWWDLMNEESSGDRLTDLFSLRLTPIRAAHLCLQEILNAFPTVIHSWANRPVETPHWDLSAGIRHVLYFMLRREYLHAGGINICRNKDCRELFEIERGGQEFCGDTCSRLQRQREYWKKRGSKLRKDKSKRRPKTSHRASATNN